MDLLHSQKASYIMNSQLKKRILFLIESLSGGGAEKVLTTLLQHLDSNRFDVTLCCIVDCGKYINDVKPYVHYTYILPNPEHEKGIWNLIYRLKYKLIYSWLPMRIVYRLFVPHHADIEVAFVEGFATRLLAHSTNKQAKKIAWVHTDLKNNHWTTVVYRNHQEEQVAYQHYDKIICVSKAVEESFRYLFTDCQDSIQTLYNPIDSQYITDLSHQYLHLHKLKGTRLVTVGRLVRQKAYSRLLNIAMRLKQSGYIFELWILGDGEEREMLQSYICENRLEDIVTLWGFQSNPYAFMSQSDLFVCSSIAEGYSTAVTEALILGLPVVTTFCSGMNELLRGGDCGIITENSEEALFDGIKQMLDQPEQLLYYKKKAFNRGKEFTLEVLMKSIEELLAR